MFVSSKHKNEKIVLGLLSYAFQDETPSIEEQKEWLTKYREDDSFDILLYKDDYSENFIGIFVIEVDFENERQNPNSIIIHRVSILPSFRGEGIGYKMFLELKDRYPKATINGVMSTADYITRWTQRYYEEK